MTVAAVTVRRPKFPRWPLGGGRRNDDERPLLVRARDQPELFAAFYGERLESVLAYFGRRVMDPEVAFDLTADTFAAAFRDLDNMRATTEDQANAWFWTIAQNRLRRYRERGAVERRGLERLGIELPSMSAVEFERAEELADLESARAGIHACLDALNPERRDAVRWRVIEERSYAEIASLAGVSEDVARARVSRGLRQLARLLDDPKVIALRDVS